MQSNDPMEHTATHSQTAKPNTWGKIQTYFIVTIISSLIWLYAESENVKQQRPLEFNVHFVAPPGQLLAIDEPIKSVSLTVRCAAGLP